MNDERKKLRGSGRQTLGACSRTSWGWLAKLRGPRPICTGTSNSLHTIDFFKIIGLHVSHLERENVWPLSDHDSIVCVVVEDTLNCAQFGGAHLLTSLHLPTFAGKIAWFLPQVYKAFLFQPVDSCMDGIWDPSCSIGWKRYRPSNNLIRDGCTYRVENFLCSFFPLIVGLSFRSRTAFWVPTFASCSH